MKRFFFLLIAAPLFFVMVLTAANGKLLIAGAAAIAFAALMIWGARLQSKESVEKITRQIKLHSDQAKWSGAELIVNPRWFKRLCFALVLLAVLWPCLNAVLTFQLLAEGRLSLFVFLLVLSAVLGYSAWLTLTGLVREIQAGYTLRLDADGFTIAGHPTMPWRDVHRAGHWYREDKGVVYHFLVLELSVSGIQEVWQSPVRSLLMGPLAIALPIMRRRGTFKLRSTFLSLPVPTIVTAMCQIGSRYSPTPVVELHPGESLEDARKLAVLWAQAIQPIDQAEQENAFKKAAASFSKPGGVVDPLDLDLALAKTLQEISARSAAMDARNQLRTQMMAQSSKQRQQQMEHDAQTFTRVFAVVAVLLLVYLVGRWMIAK